MAFEGPGITALGLAAARAVESSRPDRLIEDPFARELFAAAHSDLPMRTKWPAPGEGVSDREALHLHGSRYIGVRTRFYDDLLLDSTAEQAVLLGAGLDTRAHRLALKQRLFELDQPSVLDHKETTLPAPRCERRAVAADLSDGAWPEDLAAAGFDPAKPTAWVAEGLLPYLDVAAQANLLRHVDALSAAGSTIALDRIVGDARERAAGLTERSGIDMERLFAGGESDPAVILGWDAHEEPAEAVAARYGRSLADPFGTSAEPPWLETVFMTATKP